MEKFLSPLRNSENEGERTLLEKNTELETKPEDVDIVYEKLGDTNSVATHSLDNKSIKVKKLKIKKNRGEKRKFPDKSDSIKKFKRKKKEEKLSGNTSIPNEKSFSKENSDVEILSVEMNTTDQTKPTSKRNESMATDIDSDVENQEKPIKQKHSRKNKAVANKCRETLDVLLTFNSDVLDSMGKSLKIIKTHSLLGDKYISVDILLDLISLAVETNKGSEGSDSEKELSLLMIVTKCMNEICVTPKRSKAKQSLPAVPVSPKNKVQEEVTPSTPVSKEEVLEKQTPKNQEQDESMECGEANITIEISEKCPEPAVEKSGKNFCITNYFKKLKRTVEERDKNERFSCFTTKTDMFLAPKLGGELTGERREKFEELFNSQNCPPNYLMESTFKYKRNKRTAKLEKTSNCNSKDAKEPVSHDLVEDAVKSISEGEEPAEVPKTNSPVRKRVSLIRVDKPKLEPNEAVCRNKAKLFQFHDNRRPPYWGTWRRKSETVGARRPFGKDKMFNYEIDSDDEWEEEEEPGESLHGSDDEKEPEEDYEVDNDFFVPHGYLSDDENPEKENLSPKTKLDLLEEQFTSEQKQKTRKMTPIVFGTFWVHKGLPLEGTMYQDLQIDSLQYVPWTTIPIEIEEEEKKNENPLDQPEPTSQVKKSKQKIFPNEEIPNLIKMIHGSPQNCDHLARKFLLYWETEKIPDGNRPGLTKVCVQKKIKELAAWQGSHEKGKMCWHVPKETREEFGAEVEYKTPEKKPRKCFFWKFVRKAEKNPEGGSSPASASPPAPAPAVEPEVVLLES